MRDSTSETWDEDYSETSQSASSFTQTPPCSYAYRPTVTLSCSQNIWKTSTAMWKKKDAVFLSFNFVLVLFFFSFFALSPKRQNMWLLAPEVNFFISAVHFVWNTFIRDVRSLQSHWSRVVFDHRALPWSPKCFTSVYIHKKIGDKRGRRGVEKFSGECRLTHWVVSWRESGWNTVNYLMQSYENNTWN